jgi:hypothetical protein
MWLDKILSFSTSQNIVLCRRAAWRDEYYKDDYSSRIVCFEYHAALMVSAFTTFFWYLYHSFNFSFLALIDH